jgi:hypothetical protein
VLPDQKVVPQPVVTLRMKHGLKAKAIPRQQG